jgi:8-oxo-dGTP diphosphatase
MKLNPHISVDCVIFGFDGEKLKLLLIQRMTQNGQVDYKLPGDFITDEEDLNTAANRILKELTGLEKIFLKQFKVFGKPDRIKQAEDLRWLKETTGLAIERVVTVAYYSLVKINESRQEKVAINMGKWENVDEVKQLAFDHKEIMQSALDTLRNRIQSEPVGLELLPRKFTIRQLQNLYEIILGKKLDNRNFRKKVLKAHYLVPLEEKEKKVAHKPAKYYSFNKELFKRSFSQTTGFQF